MDKAVVVYTAPTCPDCRALKRWLEASGVPYEKRALTDRTGMEEAKVRTGVRVAPIAFVGDQFFYGRFADQRPQIAAALGLVTDAAEEGARS